VCGEWCWFQGLIVAMGKKRALSYQERFQLGYLRGFRIGSVRASRRALVYCLRELAAKDGAVIEKGLLNRIEREIDVEFLDELFGSVLGGRTPVGEVEANYDRLFLVPSGEGGRKTLWCHPSTSGGGDSA